MDNMNLDKAIKLAINGDAILFLGSGASIGAINQNDDDLVTGPDLAKRIWHNCYDLQQSVDLFLDSKREQNFDAESELIDFLKNEFRAKKITEYQKLIPNIPWKRIYTTNYDNVVEKSYLINNKNITSLTLANKAKQYVGTNDLVYLHINGSINNLSKDTLNREFKLSDVSYNTDDFSDSDWGNLFRLDLRTYSVIIFIGFSMRYDLDIRRLVNETNKEKCIFIVSENESEDNIKYLKKYGLVVCLGLNGFFDKFSEIQKEYKPYSKKTIDNTILTNFEHKNNISLALQKPTDQDVLKYYMTGKRVNELYYSDDKNYKGLIKRDIVNKIICDIKSGIKAIFIHSDIGNGKTEVIEQICIELSNDYQKYILTESNEKIAQEIEMICQSNYRNIIIIENFFNHYDIYKQFELFNSKDNITYIFTARTSIYRNRFEPFSIEPMSVYDLNKLKDDEINSLINIFEEYGYYFNNDSNTNMHKFIKSDCNSKLQSVILMMFNNTDIANSLNLLANDVLNKNHKSYFLLLFLIIVKVMALDIGFEDIMNLLKIRTYDYTFEKNQNVNELIEWKGNKTSIKSVALCIWLLKNRNVITDIVEVLVKASETADIGYEVNIRYKNFLGNIISYKHLKFVFDIVRISNSDKLYLINDFYQNIKNLNYYKDKYYFWLQYGISALELKDYAGAEMHFKAAYNKIPKDMQPFEIDNQNARLKLEIMLLSNYNYNDNTYFEFCEIDKLLTPTNAEADDKYYCFKMSSSFYRKIFDKFYSSMNDNEQEGMKHIARSNYRDCQKYIKINKNENFNKKIEEFKNEFMKLAFYESEDLVEFNIENILKYYVKGTCIKNGRLEQAQIHISMISDNYVRNINDYISQGQTVKARVVKYNHKMKCWELSLRSAIK